MQGLRLCALAAFLMVVWAPAVFAQVSIESYLYGKLSGNSVTPPLSSSYCVPAFSSATANTAQCIPGNNLTPSFAIGSSTGNTLSGPSEYFICTAACTVTPPVPVAGYQFCVENDDNVSTVITLGALGSSARYESTARTGYGTAGTGTLTSAGAVGDKVCIIGRDSTHYLTLTYTGTWVAS